jgi:gag-polypeptide of LTR copia-type
MEMVLIREKLWSIVCEKRARPDSDGSKLLEVYEEDAERAMATIFLHLDDNTERYVRDLRDPVLIWKKLREVCQSTGYAARYNLWKSLFTLAIEDNGVSGYLDRIRGIELGLRETGVVVPEELIVSATLLGLGNRFGTLVTVVTHGDPPTLDKLCAVLLDEEVKARGAEGLPREGAYLARSGPVCWHCQKPGHKQDACWVLHPELKPKEVVGTGPLPTPGAKGKMSPVERAQVAVEFAGESCW